MTELLRAISGVGGVHSEVVEDLARVHEQALSVEPLKATGCQCCPKFHEIIQ